MTTDTSIFVSLATLSDVATAALRRAGCNAAHARATAGVMVRAEQDGCSSHGLFRLPGYLAALRSGKVAGDATPVVASLASGLIRIDGQRGFAPLAMGLARENLAPLARSQGIAAAAIVNVHHFSALWVDIEPLVADGLGAFCFTSYLPVVAPAGAKWPLFGTNPMAFGFPGADGGFMFDQASASMARGELQILSREGKLAPEGVGIDAQGNATCNPAAILAGAQSPFGGHKGSSIALMVELLAGVLLGQPTSPEALREESALGALEDTGPPRGGVLLIAFDPQKFGDATGWRAHAASFFAELRALPGVRLPGDRRRRERDRIAREGVAPPAALWRDALAAAGHNPVTNPE